jgi:GT2 family glycosyltransferase
MSLRIAVTITTHNRRAELERTLGKLAHLAPAPDEIRVCADGCTDGTLELLRESHPSVKVVVHDTARGSIPSRNELAMETACDVFISLDDDSYPVATDFIRRVRELFANSPRLAVAAFAQRTDEFPESLNAGHFGDVQWVGSFANSGAAIRREAFVELRGYPGFFFHAYEEPDFALRCVNAGWQVRFEPSMLVRHHFTATERNEMRTHHRHARNECWSVLLRCPALALPIVLAWRAVRQFGYAAKRGAAWLIREPVWWWQAFRGIGPCIAAREPLPWKRYLAWMQLVRRPIHTETEWNARFGGRIR